MKGENKKVMSYFIIVHLAIYLSSCVAHYICLLACLLACFAVLTYLYLYSAQTYEVIADSRPSSYMLVKIPNYRMASYALQGYFENRCTTLFQSDLLRHCIALQ